MRLAPLCNSLRDDVASIETYSSWVNCPKEKCVSADLMHLFPCSFCDSKINIIVIINGCLHNGPVICPRLVIMAHEYLEPTTICTCKTDNFLINNRNQQLYVLAKQTIHALLKFMVKMNTRNLQLYVLEKNRQFSNKHSEPTTICSCKTENKCTAKAHGQNEYSELKER